MNDRLPIEHKQQLQNLHWEYKSASSKLEREAKFENFMKVLGAFGLLIIVTYFIDREAAIQNFGEVGVGLGLGATLFGGWAFFFPSSTKPDRYEQTQMRKVNDELDKLGYQRGFTGDQVARKGSSVFLDVFQGNNYKDFKISSKVPSAQVEPAKAERPTQEAVSQQHEPDVPEQTSARESEWVRIATLPKADFANAMLTLFKEVEQNGNVQQLVAYSTVKAMFNAAQRVYEQKGREFNKLNYIEEIELIIGRRPDKAAKRKLQWMIQAVLLWHLEEQAENDDELHTCLVEIWSHMLSCCFIVKTALESNVIWSEDDKVHFDSFALRKTKTVLMTMKTMAPKQVQDDPTFKQDYKEVMSFVGLTEGMT